ncbi:MAG TPA: MFS transporter [Vicinamibacterales bacterium]|nr:MFS transporter [Vicinamibacterales bacterium]
MPPLEPAAVDLLVAPAAAPRPAAPHPWVWFVLYFPFGLSFGFPSIALGYLAVQAGVSVGAVAGVVGMTLLASGWKFVWAPVGDYTLSRKRWYLLATGIVTAGFITMTAVPLSTRTVPVMSLLVLLTAVAATFVAFATEGLMVHNTPLAARGRAAAWFESGNHFGQTAGGGLALYFMKHAPTPWIGGGLLGIVLFACAIPLLFLEEPPRPLRGASVGARARDAWRELVGILRTRAGRIALILAILPIGTGAAHDLFGSLAPEWHAPADTVSLVLGLGGGVAIVLGCFAGGWLADRVNRPVAYALSCALGLVACVAMAWSPRTEMGYTVTTLLYTFSLGACAASFMAMALAIIGRSAAATKLNIFIALNTLFSLGMLRVDGWAHDGWGTNGMLYTEALTGVAALIVFAALVGKIPGAALAEEV